MNYIFFSVFVFGLIFSMPKPTLESPRKSGKYFLVETADGPRDEDTGSGIFAKIYQKLKKIDS